MPWGGARIERGYGKRSCGSIADLFARGPMLNRVPLLMLILLVAGCGGGPAPQARTSGADTRPEQSRTLVAITRAEPDSIASKEFLRTTGLSFRATARLFNAELTTLDGNGAAQPYLAEKLPELHSDSWRVFPDGRMETVYRLRPGLTWHDGVALTAHDFVFAWSVYSTPGLGASDSPPSPYIGEVVASDERTVLIRWKRPYPEAASVGSTDREFQPLPRHLLERTFLQDPSDSFGRLAFWTTEYVAAGPYRLERWAAGAFLEGVAFQSHALGKPPIERVRLLFLGDFNTALANMLSGEAHVAWDDSLRHQQALVLKREWGVSGGSVVSVPAQWRRQEPQHRPEYAQPRAILELRVRQAIAHAIDRQALVDVLFDGEGQVADSFVTSGASFFPELDRVVAKYPFDPRRTDELMSLAGWNKGADGFFIHPVQGRFSGEIKINASTQSETELAITAAGLRTSGFDLTQTVVPPAQSRNGEVRGTYPTLYGGNGGVGERGLLNLPSANIPSADNRWVGTNRAGWSNSEYDRLLDLFQTTLDRSERDRQVIAMMKLYSEDVGAISLYYDLKTIPYSSLLQGPAPFVPETDVTWQVHTWRWR